MAKRVLITAGPVYGRLDDNKIVSNRSRGLWAVRFADSLLDLGYEVTLLVADVAREMMMEARLSSKYSEKPARVIEHHGYDDYRRICRELAPQMDAAVMSAAVVNWIPEEPFPGKMPINIDRQLIPFILAPKVIREMKVANPKLTLIGCKLLFGGDVDALIEAAYRVVLDARCNAVVANDARLGLRRKFVVHQDRTVIEYNNNFAAFNIHLRKLIEAEYYSTEVYAAGTVADHFLPADLVRARQLFNVMVDRYRLLFLRPTQDSDRVFGAVATRIGDRYLVSPREKGGLFTAEDAVAVMGFRPRKVLVVGGKASLNAPLLIKHLEKFPQAAAVVHVHDNAPAGASLCIAADFRTVPYAPPGTVADNDRLIPGPCYKIEGHGWIIAVDEKGEPIL